MPERLTKDSGISFDESCAELPKRTEVEQVNIAAAVTSASDAETGTPHQRRAQGQKRKRKDTGGVHVVSHGLLSRDPFEILRRLGENPQKLRRLERRLRKALRPEGEIGKLIFDKLWSSHLRSLLAARLEALIIARLEPSVDRPTSAPILVDRENPTLVYSERMADRTAGVSPLTNILTDLCLLEKYSVHIRKEEFRALALLLVSLGHGEDGLAESIGQILGLNSETGRDRNHA